MKTKTFSRRLVFNKETVSNLNQAELNGIRGGTFIDISLEVGVLCYPNGPEPQSSGDQQQHLCFICES